MTGTLIIVSAPSGAGKTSIVNAVVQADDHVSLSVSHTTRAIRPGERDGVDYHFITRAEFRRMAVAGEFAEHAEVFGNLYGTARWAIERQLAADQDVIVEIDWQGAAQLRRTIRTPTASVFVLPPSRASLRQRLTTRGQDDHAVIDARMSRAIDEMSHYCDYDYLVINDAFDEAVAGVRGILSAERLRRDSQRERHAQLLNDLLSGA